MKRFHRAKSLSIIGIIALSVLLSLSVPTFAGTIKRISVGADGSDADRGGAYPSVSSDGSVAFSSESSNLAPDCTGGFFVYDGQTGEIECIAEAYQTYQPSISDDGRYVSYKYAMDIYVHDRQKGATTTVDLSAYGIMPLGASSQTMSSDGSSIAFNTYDDRTLPGVQNCIPNFFVVDLQTGIPDCVQDDMFAKTDWGGVSNFYLSGDGSRTVFRATRGYFTNKYSTAEIEVYLYDFIEGTIKALFQSSKRSSRSGLSTSISSGGEYAGYMISMSGSAKDKKQEGAYVATVSGGKKEFLGTGTYGPRLSGDGSVVVYCLVDSDAYSNYIPLYLYDRKTGEKELIANTWRNIYSYDISDDGRYVVFTTNEALDPEDANGISDVYLFDRGFGTDAY
jgi:Tol biopolymer transport system component